MRLLLDTRPLRESAAFRRLWVGSSLSGIGAQMTLFAVALQVFTLTRSSVAVGAVGLAMAVPAIVVGPLGGAIGDAVDRRRLVLATGLGLAGVSTAFAVQAYAGLDRTWLLYVLVAAQAVLGALSTPARRTFLPRLLPAHRLPAGAALTMVSAHASVIVGPLVAGVVAGVWGLKACYAVDVLSFAAGLYGVARLPAMPPEGGLARPGLRAVGAALRFIRGNRILTGAFLADLSATVLGMPVALFPAINAARFGGGAQTLGLLSAALAAGGVVGSVFSGPVARVARQGRAMLIGGAAWGAGLVGFGLASRLWLALAMLVVAGAADVISVVFRTTMVAVLTPDRYRGRVNAVEFVVGVGCPQLGNFRAGAVGSLTTPAVSAVSGGLAAIAGAGLVALAVPAFARYRAAGDPASRASARGVGADQTSSGGSVPGPGLVG